MLFSLLPTFELLDLILQEWGSDCPSEYLGSYRLEADQSWTPEEKFQEKDNDKVLIDKILTYSSTAAAITNQ